MISVLTAIILGVLIGRITNAKVLRINDKSFTVLSTLFVFLMGISLGLSKSIFLDAQSLLVNSVIASVVLSLGSILSVMTLTKFIIKSDV